MNILEVNDWLKLYRIRGLRHIARAVIRILGADIPIEVSIGKNALFKHNGLGTVIHPSTTIEENVKIYQNVTIGRADCYKRVEAQSKLDGFIIKKGARICAGACILAKEGILTVGEDSVIAANSVLLNSTGPGEVWGGVPC